MTRREILTSLGALPVLYAAPRTAWGRATPARQCDEPLAALGALLAVEDPALARSLARDVEAWIRQQGRRLKASDRACAVRRSLLDPARLAGEYERREIVRIDGWVLARSEASACAYLNAIDGRLAHSV